MTNNLKAERTLTAERLEDIKNQLGDDTFAGIIRTAELKVPELRSIIDELQAFRSQSLSTQQPMGKVTTRFQMLMDAYVRGYAWSLENPDSQAFVHKAAYDYADKTTSALHPNQESGE